MKKRTAEKRSEFPEWINQYLDGSRLTDNSKVAYTDRIHSVMSFINQETGTPMNELSPETIESVFSIEKYCEKRIAGGCSKKTVENEVKTFSSMFNRVVGKEHYHSVKDMPEEMQTEYYSMSDEEFDKYQIMVMDAFRKLLIDEDLYKHRDALILLLIYEMGLKVSECTGINLDDIQENYIRINRAGIRKIEIPRNVQKELDRYMKERQALLDEKDNDKFDGTALLIGTHRTRLSNRSIEMIVKNAFGKETEMTPELLRKVSGIYRYKQTGSVEYVALYLGINTYAAEVIVGNVRKCEGSYIPIPS